MSTTSPRVISPRAALWLLALGVAALISIAAAQPAQAYSGCWGSGPVAKDPYGPAFHTKYCHNYRSGHTRTWGPTGLLWAGTNWFRCQQKGSENPRVGSARNDWSLWTQADVAYALGGWGWFPATYVSGGGNYAPIPGLPRCPPYLGRP